MIKINLPFGHGGVVLASLKKGDGFMRQGDPDLYCVVEPACPEDVEMQCLRLSSSPCMIWHKVRDLVEPMDIEISARRRNVPMTEDLVGGLTFAERELVSLDKKIHAIKCIRQRRGIGLKEAKDMVDAYVASLVSSANARW